MQLRLDELELSQKDRNGFTLFGSALIHIVLIMGLGFSYTFGRQPEQSISSISTVLVSAETEEKPDDAELFARAAQMGGGLEQNQKPVRSPLPTLSAAATRAPEQSNSHRRNELWVVNREFLYVNTPDSVFVSETLDTSEKSSQTKSGTENEKGAEAMLKSPILAQLDTDLSLGGKIPRQKFISSRTREHKYASYMEAWRAKVEQIGNANYPDVARQKKLSGNLVLNVSIQPDGNIENIKVIRSSGQKVLDDAAIRIVMMAAPFDPFPDEVRKEADVVHITRTWQFLHNSALIKN